jgi:hypothetical protein
MLMAALFAMQGLDIYVDFSDEPRTEYSHPVCRAAV